jgi:hypothetical protein
VLLLEDPPLSLEDVPPRSVGGKPIALTCKGCNNAAGPVIDIAMKRRADLMRLDALIRNREDGEARRLTLNIGSERVNIKVVSKRHSPVKLEILGRWNDPSKIERGSSQAPTY